MKYLRDYAIEKWHGGFVCGNAWDRCYFEMLEIIFIYTPILCSFLAINNQIQKHHK